MLLLSFTLSRTCRHGYGRGRQNSKLEIGMKVLLLSFNLCRTCRHGYGRGRLKSRECMDESASFKFYSWQDMQTWLWQRQAESRECMDESASFTFYS